MIAPAPMAQRKQGGGKGLVIGLGGLGAILLVAMVVVAARSMKGDGEEVTTLTIPTSSAPAATGIAEVKPTETQDTPPDTPPSDSSAGTETAGGPKPSPAPSPAPKSNPSPGPAPAPAATPKGDPCDACINAAQSGNISGAAAAAGKCSDAGKKAQCQSIVKSKAPPLAQAAAFNGNCTGAKAIAAAATQMGAGSGSLNSKLKSCK
jgi:outer membrane biosynthesis protein TonB